ncbi:delta-aminolevulinic acid dehydratase [Methanobrevibacter sp. 87.7]|uniref:porphobilinogen synthase n=1 Tax=Methanobrevibacter sp. 87.7 TaxID=387957 RepID=UPI000B50FFBF|nr:porphobilinogen synthase [Methanobrevibacter sp. 87.7]OWT32364.1 delta-aminolevulinic acid dehydratase [Methanobrevibacter sp. 87.7]
MDYPIVRMRRLRKNANIREIVRETKVNKEDLIYPIYFKEDLKGDEKEEIPTMPNQFGYSIESGVEYAKKLEAKGLKSIIVFGIPNEDTKDEVGSPAFREDGIVQKAIKALKENTDLVVIGDVCLCQYTSHGHCGLIKEYAKGDFEDNIDDGIKILNDPSLEYLAKTAVSQAKAGADAVAPSDMMDGRVEVIRNALDANGFEDVMVISYSAKFASSFYAPFRDAANSTPGKGNRRSYQMDPANGREAIRECELDVIEGADMLMVKPALPYLDVISKVKEEFNLPLVTYNVSGEYSMLVAAIDKGYLTEDSIMESLVSIKRAGADLIITYFAPFVLDKL